MGGYMQFNYDDIEGFIFSIYKARVEIKTLKMEKRFY